MKVGPKDVGFLYTKDGTDAWRLVSYCDEPTVTLRNLETGEEVHAAASAPLVERFQRLEPSGAA